jgi:UDP-N-acetylglucosamine 2-epimerase (non-hydrolysing)
MSKIFFKELDVPKPDYDLKVGSDTHARQTANIMVALDRLLKKYRPDIIIAEGDTNTVVAASLTAIKEKIPFAHVEAGLRSYDRNMPEEINRCVAGVCAELHFAPTENAAANLTYEGIPPHKIFVTGNTIVDVIASNIDKKHQRKLRKKFRIDDKKTILLTLHRAENVDDRANLLILLRSVISLKPINIIFPVHPRTLHRLKEFGLYDLLTSAKNIVLTEPLGYFDFLNLLSMVDCVMTDSGGVQEEAFTTQVPTITLRYNTERPETVWHGGNVLVALQRDLLINAVKNVFKQKKRTGLRVPNELGDGRAGKRIADIVSRYLQRRRKHFLNVMESGSAIHRTIVVNKSFHRPDAFRKIWITAIYDRTGKPISPKNTHIKSGYMIRLFGPKKEVNNAVELLGGKV